MLATSCRARCPQPVARRQPVAVRPVKLPAPSVRVRSLPEPGAETVSYSILATAFGSFLATFLVLPKLYAQNTNWREMLPELQASGLRSVAPREAYSKAGSSVLLDVRLADAYAKEAPAKSVNVPLYIPIQAWDIPSIIRRLGFAFFGVYGTELNPDFISQVQEAVPRGREIMVICEAGGSIESKAGNTLGFQSRSLKAIYYLQQAGFTKVSHVSGGLSSWVREGLPTSRSGNDDDDGGDAEQVASAKTLSLPFMRQ